MRQKWNRISLVLLLALGLATGAYAQTDTTCSSDSSACDSGNTFTVQLGGDGSIGSDGTQNPAVCDGGTSDPIAMTTAVFTYNDAGTLTIDLANDGEGPATLGLFFFNTKDAVTGLSFVSDTDADDTWQLCGASKADGFGTFDWVLSACVCPDPTSNNASCNTGLDVGESATITLSVTPANDTVSACDFIDKSVPPPSEKLSDFVGKYQRCGDDNNGSEFINDCGDGDLFVEIDSIATVPADGKVTVNWRTLLEIDNQGFYMWRADPASGEVRRVSGFIPAIAENNSGAEYSFEDATAVNGVEYTYLLEDIDIFGLSSNHPGVGAIPNPTSPIITLQAPQYGTTVPVSTPLTVRYAVPGSGFYYVNFSSDPSFASRDSLMIVRGSFDGNVTLNWRQMRRLNEIAAAGDGNVYWRVVELGSDVVRYSQTWKLDVEFQEDVGRGQFHNHRIQTQTGAESTDADRLRLRR